MNIHHQRASLEQQLAPWRKAGDSIALVPTMGNLHAGHLALVEAAKREADHVVVSIFVNPTQFGPNEDFDSYPRTLDADCAKLDAIGTDAVFAPSVEEVYPQSNLAWVDIEQLGDSLCGAKRPGHFRGVCTVVSKLFNLVRPDVACFGEKDFQQLAILRRMTQDLCFPIRIVGVPTVREEDGLALSSRNGYLSAEERALAPKLQANLKQLATHLQQGNTDFTALTKEASQRLNTTGFRVDYLSIISADTLAPATASDKQLLVAAAAYLGNTRLIDNIAVNIDCDR